MVTALQTPATEHPPKKITVDSASVVTKNPADFVPQKTHRFFSITSISSAFLSKDVDLWSADEDYRATKKTISGMRVTNDIAERGVALMEEYNTLHTKNEQQKQFLLLIVKGY
jgi:hypothetical protein